MAFKKGNSFAKGGARPNSGPAPEWLKDKCRSIVDKNSLVEFLSDVAKGERVERIVTDEGGIIDVAASVKDRMRAIEMLLDRGWGKASQEVEHKGEIGVTNRVIMIKRAADAI